MLLSLTFSCLTYGVREQKQLAIENPIAASAASGSNQTQSNVENLLDIDFDGAIPASLQDQSTSSGLDDLVSNTPSTSQSGPPNTMDDLMGLFGNQLQPQPQTGDDLMNGFGRLDLSGSQPQPQASKRTNDDILGLF